MKIQLIAYLTTIFLFLIDNIKCDYIGLHECIQNKCFSLYTYCQNEPKCKKSYQLVNLCSQINPNRVQDCIGNIHNYLHVALQQCLTNECGYNDYYQSCSITNSKIRNCIDDNTSQCYLTQGGSQFSDAVNKCILETKPKQCGDIPKQYSEYVVRCSDLNKLSCYQSSLEKASQNIQQLFACHSIIISSLAALFVGFVSIII